MHGDHNGYWIVCVVIRPCMSGGGVISCVFHGQSEGFWHTFCPHQGVHRIGRGKLGIAGAAQVVLLVYHLACIMASPGFLSDE